MTTTNGTPPAAATKTRPKWVQSAIDTLREASKWRELRRTPYGLTPVVFIGALTFFGGLSAGILSLAGPEIRRDLELDFSTIIFISSLVGFVLVFTNIGVAYYADRHKRVPLVVAGFIFSGITRSFLAFAQKGKGWTLAAPQVIGRVGSDVALTPSNSLLADWYPPESRGRVFAVIGVAGSVVSLVTLTIGGYLAKHIGWRACALIFSPALALVGVWAMARLRRHPRSTQLAGGRR